MRLRIFVSAYACEPGLGSEIGVGWHWVLEMSKYFDLWVLTRRSNRQTIEPWIEAHPQYSGIRFLYYDLPKWARFWKRGLRGVRTYYNLWQWRTNKIVRQTMQQNGIGVFHHLTYGNCLWKVSSYGQRQFFIWGPIGGAESIPEEFTRHYDLKSRLMERVRRWVVKSLKHNRGFHARCRRADVILCKTEITREAIPVLYRDKAVLFTDVAVDTDSAITAEKAPSSGERIEYLAVGRLDAWRGFDLAIESFARAVQADRNIHLTIVGDGRDRERLLQLIAVHQLSEHVSLPGKLAREEYYALMEKADVVVNPSLKEGAVTVSFDSMAFGKPLICLDTTGYTRYFSDDYAHVIPIRGRDRVIEDIKTGILFMTDAAERTKMGAEARKAGARFTWQSRGEEIHRLFSEKL